MKVRYKMTVKNGPKTVATIEGREGGVDASRLTIGDVVEGVAEAEALLERLTGLRFHIEQMS